MTSTRDIKNRILSIGNIKKITETMGKIATVKMKKNITRLSNSKEYLETLISVISRVLYCLQAENKNQYLNHPLIKRHEKSLGEKWEKQEKLILVISSNRGLCGGYNSHIVDLAKKLYNSKDKNKENKQLYIIGIKGVHYFEYMGEKVTRSWNNIDDQSSYEQIMKIAHELEVLYTKEKIDQVDCVYTKYYSAGLQKSHAIKLLPLSIEVKRELQEKKAYEKDYIFEPNVEKVLSPLFYEVFRTQFFHAVLESHLSEQIARKMAMKKSSDAASDMIQSLKLEYNKARQNKITKELIEIMAASKSLKG